MTSNNINTEFQLLEIENQNLLTSLEMFEIVKETAEEYCQYIKKYKECTSLYYEKISKLSYNKKEVKNKNIKISPIFSIIDKVPNLITLQVEGLKQFINSFDIVLKQLEDILKNELDSLEEPKKSFEESKKKYKLNKIKNKKLMDNLSSLEKKIINYQLSKKEKENAKDMKDILNNNINETKNIEKEFLNINKSDENFHKVFQDESLQSIDKIKLHIGSILQNLNTNIIFFLLHFNQCYSPSVKFIETEEKKEQINTNNLVNENLILKVYNLEEIPTDKYNIKILNNSELDMLSDSIDDIDIKEPNLKKFSFFGNKKKPKEEFDILSKVSRKDMIEIVKKFYDNFQMVNKDKFDISVEEEKIEVKILSDKLLLMNKYKNKNNANEEKITDEEKEKLFSMITKKENRLTFLRRLNKIRTFGNFEYPKNIIDDIIKIFFIMLDNILIEKDIFSFQFSIILSQTFFFIENEEKKYIFKYTKSHKIYQSEEIWRNSYDYFINKEIEKFKNNILIKPDIKQYKNRINEMLFAQIIAVTNNMIEFDLDIEITEKINNDILNKYEIKDEQKKIIMSIIKNKKNKDNINKNEDNIIIENNEKNKKIENINDIKEEKIENDSKIKEKEKDNEEENKK